MSTPRGLPALLTALVVACGEPAPAVIFEHRSLDPYDNPFGPSELLFAPQPHRDNPAGVAWSADGGKLYVTLGGSEDFPGRQVAVVDVAAGRVLRRIEVGRSPVRAALHPDGRFLVVTNRFSNWASIIDTTIDEVVRDVEVPFYTIDVAFTPDGRVAYFTNRWKDSVLRWDLAVGERFEVRSTSYDGLALDQPMGVAVGSNPRDIAVTEDGRHVLAASLSSLDLHVLDAETGRWLFRIDINSPVHDVATLGRFAFLGSNGPGTGGRPAEGFDTNADGHPGDGTANVMFQDVQNEIAVVDLEERRLVRRYTSDTICCRDFRDVNPDDPSAGADLPDPDTWTPDRVPFLEPEDTWIVAGALPEQIVAGRRDGTPTLVAVFSASNEVQSFRIDLDEGALVALQAAGGLFATGMNPVHAALSPDGRSLATADHLGESVTRIALGGGPGDEERIVVGDEAGGAFPATDVELGEAFNNMTSLFTVDGDQACVQCHREGGNIAKPVAMPLQQDFAWGTRQVQAYRGAFDSRPWFLEGIMEENNFFAVINEFARKENFCCEEQDPRVWSRYPTQQACFDDPELDGCEHVLDCPNNPPPECRARRYDAPTLTRNEFFLRAARATFGRDRTFGDSLWLADAEGVRQPVPLDFNGITKALGVFLLDRPRLLPNPNQALDLPAARRGEALFRSAETACNLCHPLPLTTVATTPAFNPFGAPIRFPPLITPRRRPDTGANVDLLRPAFMQTFATGLLAAEQGPEGVRFQPPTLRGIWDRAPSFYHDGRAPTLREALVTPGHPALEPGERGFNERDLFPNTHGSTSHLTPSEVRDLITFLLTL
jgi:DNA-binding beta-propeller fold protein YncE